MYATKPYRQDSQTAKMAYGYISKMGYAVWFNSFEFAERNTFLEFASEWLENLNLHKLAENEVEFTIECLPEHIPVRGNAMCSGDDEFDKSVEDKIIAEIDWNPWSWCCVKVTAKWKKFTGVDYLGACSYQSKQSFIDCDDYYTSMKQQALDDLNSTIQEYAESILS